MATSNKTTSFIYVIKCVDTDKAYVGKSTSTNPKYDPISWMIRTHKRDPSKYISFNESINENSKSNHIYGVLRKGLTSDQADQIAYDLATKLTEKNLSLNDKIIPPTKYKCVCGANVREYYRKKHEENYCSANMFDEYIDIIPDE